MAVVFSRDDYEQGGTGNKKLHVRLSTVLYLRDLMDAGQHEDARAVVELILDFEERERLRALRNEVYHRKEHARTVGDMDSYRRYDGLLQDCTQAAKDISV